MEVSRTGTKLIGGLNTMRDESRSYFEEEHYTDNPTVWRHVYYFRVLYCNYCPPNGGENQRGRYQRHDRYKSVRKGRCSGSIEPPCRDEDGSPSWECFKRPFRTSRYYPEPSYRKGQ
jgi:hypothetical protein